MGTTWIDTAVPIILILIVIGWAYAKFNKQIKQLFEWLKEVFRSKKKKAENPNTYSYIDYDGY